MAAYQDTFSPPLEKKRCSCYYCTYVDINLASQAAVASELHQECIKKLSSGEGATADILCSRQCSWRGTIRNFVVHSESCEHFLLKKEKTESVLDLVRLELLPHLRRLTLNSVQSNIFFVLDTFSSLAHMKVAMVKQANIDEIIENFINEAMIRDCPEAIRTLIEYIQVGNQNNNGSTYTRFLKKFEETYLNPCIMSEEETAEADGSSATLHLCLLQELDFKPGIFEIPVCKPFIVTKERDNNSLSQ